MCTFRIAVVTIMLALPLCAPAQLRVALAAETGQVSEVGELILRLGSDSYATRIRARDKLQRMGLEAFDALRAAQFHEDSEIASAARFLVNSYLVSWSKETDPPEVRNALNEYGAQDFSERSSRIQRLAELPKRAGLAALVRLTRFETDLRLSRQAALALMQQEMSDDQETRNRHAEVIRETLKDDDLQASQWLNVYAADLAAGKYSADLWSDLVSQQRLEIDAATSQNASRKSVLSLVRVCAQRAAASGQSEEALRLAVDNMDLIPPKTQDLKDACSWAIDNRLHKFVLRLRDEHQRMFDRQPKLLYAAAEATRVDGSDEHAEQLATQALGINPFPESDEEKAKLPESALEEIAQAHREIAQDLQSRGLFEWAENEFRLIINQRDIESVASASARQGLARMFAELQRHGEVVEVYEPLIERMDNDRALKNKLMFNRFPYDFMRSEVEFHRGMQKLKEGNTEEAKQFLIRGWHLNRYNIDILIAMYRLKSDDDWTETVNRELRSEIRNIESEIRVAETRNQQNARLAGASEILAEKLNQYAWLVANTEGDYDRALRESQRSLELTADDPAKLDTCARCYFAVKQYDNAVKTQRRAVRLEPHSPPMKRQLAEFEKAAAEHAAEQND
jgi:hypothetical protein